VRRNPSHPRKRHLQRDNTGSLPLGEPVFLAVGYIRRPHGVRGEMLMDLLTDFPERLVPGKRLYLGEEHLPVQIRSVRPALQAVLIAFEEFEDRDQVAAFRNQYLYVRADELPPLPEGEYYHHQLLGLMVFDREGHSLGVLTEILETGANDVYVVRDEQGREILLPVIEGVILEVDLETHRLIVNPPEWL
jgi:16S rRNA processing protein RimM